MNKLCVYLNHPNEYPDTENATKEYKYFAENRPQYCDHGDDPSFYCAGKFDSNITWAVCRHNVRRLLEKGDEVHFVACDKTNYKADGTWNYYYVGYGVVENLITHKDIYERKDYYIFQNYFNLLIKPNRRGYVHWEPFNPKNWHEDWMMRISNAVRWSDLESYQNQNFKSHCGGKNNFNKNILIKSNFPIGNNYIIFDKTNSKFNLLNPGLILQVKWIGFRKYESIISNKKFHEVLGNSCLTNGSYQHPARDLDKKQTEILKTLLN